MEAKLDSGVFKPTPNHVKEILFYQSYTISYDFRQKQCRALEAMRICWNCVSFGLSIDLL